MPTYTILGATGNCGSALVQILLQNPANEVHAYVRNKQKLLRLLPEIAEDARVQIWEGSIGDVELLTRCVRGSRTVFHTVSTNDNVPGCSVGLETAHSIVGACERIRKEAATTQLPNVCILSSATIDPHLSRNMPRIFKPIMLTAASHVYDDLRRAEAYLRAQHDWLQTIFIKPAGLSVDAQRGHVLTMDEEESFISYLDLAAGMVEAAGYDDHRYDQANVGVINKAGSAKFPAGTPRCILLGLLRHFFPFLHPYLPSSGPA